MIFGDLTAKPVKDQTTQRILHHNIAHVHLLLGLLEYLDLNRGQKDEARLLHQLLELLKNYRELIDNSIQSRINLTHIFCNVLINLLNEALVVIDAR